MLKIIWKFYIKNQFKKLNILTAVKILYQPVFQLKIQNKI